MNIDTCASIFAILLLVFQVNCSCPVGSNQLDTQCSTYCYQVVKPLLLHLSTIKTLTQEQNELQNTIKLQEQVILNLNQLIKSKEVQIAQQIKLSETLESNNRNQQNLIDQYKLLVANESCESRNRNQQKLIDQYEMQLSILKSEAKSKDNKIRDLQSENVKTKKLQDEISAYKQTSSCLGKLTEIHAIRVPSAQTMMVPCDSNMSEAGAGWTVLLRRKDGSVNFNRTWSEYKEGFGHLRGEFFLGLEKLHLLTQSQPHELYISIMDFKNETRYARYNNFVVGNETEFYELKEVGTYSGNAGDSMAYHKNQKFSTSDHYKHAPSFCARDHISGWWFQNCFHSNLNGRYVYEDPDKDVNSIEWRTWKYRPMKFAQMMIRPITN